MMEIHDELITPGCPQCAVKHLSAALYHRARLVGGGEGMEPDPCTKHLCVAYINLVEVRTGYLSHLWYAVGALARSEERMAWRIGECVARRARLMLEEHGLGAVMEALRIIDQETVPTPADWAAAHFDEARRELPAFADEMSMDDLIGTIERIRKEFFDFDEAPAASDASAEKGGETDMTKKTAKVAAKAAAKAVAKKAAVKAATKAATKAACKGGKCKSSKAACKGGKCKDK